LSCLVGVFALGLAACGDDDDSGGSSSGGDISGNELTIYSSLPLQGTSKGQSEAVINGEKLALKEVGGKVGKYTIKYVSLR
jgi:branched-chain amino acid transport system substrate-binding protein